MISRKTEDELKIMRVAGRIVAETHQAISKVMRPGITTLELDHLAEEFIRSQDAVPSFKGYHGFPGSICASVNDELVHGIPGQKELKEGDIITIDIGAQYQGYHGDSAWTYSVGNISEATRKLLEITEKSLFIGLAEAKPGTHLSTISHTIQRYVEEAGFSIVREYAGHGIGANLHEEPQIPNYGLPGKGPKLKPGMVLAIEPMVIAGGRYVKTLKDNWTVVSLDASMCAHYEHTIAITETGYEILTKPGV